MIFFVLSFLGLNCCPRFIVGLRCVRESVNRNWVDDFGYYYIDIRSNIVDTNITMLRATLSVLEFTG